MVAHFNELRKLGDEQVTEVLLFKKIYNLEYEPNDGTAYKEEGNDPGHKSIKRHVKHSVWPILVLPIVQSTQ